MTGTPGAAGPAPAGAVTHGFLFADLRGYTRYVDAHGDHAAAELLDRYRSLVRGEVSAFRGAEIRTEGDSFYVVFDSAGAAVRCGLAIVAAAAATAEGPADAIQVGVGVHAGETVETPEGYVGLAVNIAARLCAQAKAGELVVSDTVRSLTRTYLDVEFEPMGTRRLKGLDEPIAIDRVTPRGPANGQAAHARRAGTRRRWWVAGAAAVALVIVMGVVGAAMWRGGGPSPTLVPNAVPTPSPVEPSASGPLGPLRGDEQDLLARIPGDFQPYCSRSNKLDGSLGGGPSLRCDLSLVLETEPVFGADSVWYDQFGSQGQMSAAVNKVAVKHQLPDGDCGPQGGQALDRWTFGNTFTGQLACYTEDGAAWIVWSYDGQSVAARAERLDGDAARLYAWWHEVSGYLRPS
jgi:class 3 adenylate cyclase